MISYFEARKAAKILRHFQELAATLWSAAGEEDRGGNDLRNQIARLTPVVKDYAKKMGLSFTFAARRSTDHVSQVTAPADLLSFVLARKYGPYTITESDVAGAIEQCIGMAKHIQKVQFWKQAINPFYYLIETAAYLLRVPFLILQRAGLPEAMEHTQGAYAIKAAMLVLALLLLARYGFNLTMSDLAELFR
jgi:hypothetical protein